MSDDPSPIRVLIADTLEPLEPWRLAWRQGIAPQLSEDALMALEAALASDNPAIIQGATFDPPPLLCFRDWPVQAACPIGYAIWQGDSIRNVHEVEEAFIAMSLACNKLVGTGGFSAFLSWVDDSPRKLMRRELAEEVQQTLIQRQEVE